MRTEWTPSIVPNVGDVTVYLVEDDFGKIGRCYRETDTEKIDLETTIRDLISGPYNDPVRIVSFNTAEGWSRDVSEDIAREIQRRFDVLYEDLPSHLSGFIEGRSARAASFALRLDVMSSWDRSFEDQ